MSESYTKQGRLSIKKFSAVDQDASGVDISEHVTFQYEDKMASSLYSCRAAVEERLVLSDTEGRIVMTHPHNTAEAL